MIVATMRFQHLKALLFKAKNSYTKRLIVHEIIPPLATKFVTSSKPYALKGQCHAIWQLYKNLEGVFVSIEFQN